MPSETIELDDKKLKDFIKAFKGKLPQARVGILGDNATRSSSEGQTNAEIGLAHEFGTRKLPRRSFLRVPLTDHLQKYLEKTGALNPATLEQVIKDKSLHEWIKQIGILGEAIVLEAFSSGGFGEWKPSNMHFKHNWQTLVETGQLMKSITSEVVE